MTRITGASLAGVALSLVLLSSTAGYAQTDMGGAPPPAATPTPPAAPVAPNTPSVPVLQPLPTTQAQPAVQSNSSPQRYFGGHPSSRSPLPSGSVSPGSNNLPVAPKSVTPTPKLLENGALSHPEDHAQLSSKKKTKHKTAKRKSTRHRTARHTTARHSSHTSGRSHVRTAQVYLEQLGYEPGPTDGMMGRKTKVAIKEFQRDHRLKPTGVLNESTFAALEREAGSKNPSHHGPEPQADFIGTHPDFYGYYGNNEGMSPTSLSSPQAIPSRYGNLQVEEQKNGPVSTYVVSVNGQQVYRADNQPSYINVSRTFEVGDDDAIVVTSYNNGNQTCHYQHRLLIIKSSGNFARDIPDCTRDYEAYTQNGMLMVTFPGDQVNGWSSGTAWRYDHGTFEKL